MSGRFNWAMEKMGWRIPEEDDVEEANVEIAEVREYPFAPVSTSASEEVIHTQRTHMTIRDSRSGAGVDSQDRRRIVTVHPQSYSDALKVGESFREGVPVIMNLTDMDDAEARRIIDFAAGLTFGLYGEIERVTTRVFLLSPADTDVSDGHQTLRGRAY